MLSDPVGLDVPAASDLAISIYMPRSTTGWTIHAVALQSNYWAPAGVDYSAETNLPIDKIDARCSAA